MIRAVAARPCRWLAIALLWPVAYHAAQLLAAALRFGAWPSYGVVYPFPHNLGLILRGTPSLRDVIQLVLVEPIAEAGYASPVTRSAEWAVSVLPGSLALQLVVGALIATLWALARDRPACPAPVGGGMLATLAVGAAAIGGATISWVACCGAPSWITVLTMMGVGVISALAVEPYGPWLTVGGVLLLAAAVAARARTPVAAP